MISKNTIRELFALQKEFNKIKKGKSSLLLLIIESEISEMVYNSNAIENSTLTLQETEKVLLELSIAREISLREVFEAKNLAMVYEYIESKKTINLTEEILLFLHNTLLESINKKISGRYRSENEFVRIGNHIATPPEFIHQEIKTLFEKYSESQNISFIERIAYFHLEFETIHPFCDGNGRIGRVLINYQLALFGFPPVIIRNSEKQKYYECFKIFRKNGSTKEMEKILLIALKESFHKRFAYLKSKKIINVTDYAREKEVSSSSLLNKASRQTIPAFREKERWKIGVEY